MLTKCKYFQHSLQSLKYVSKNKILHAPFLTASSDAVSSPGMAAESRCGYTSVAISSRAGSVAVGATRAGKSEVLVGEWEGARKIVSRSAGEEGGA